MSAAGEPFLRDRIARRRTARFGSSLARLCSVGRRAFTRPGWSRERSSRDRSAEPRHAGLCVLEAPSQELGLLVEAKLPDGSVGDRALAIVGAPRRRFEILRYLAPKIRKLPLVGKLGGAGRCLRKIQTDVTDRVAGPV